MNSRIIETPYDAASTRKVQRLHMKEMHKPGRSQTLKYMAGGVLFVLFGLIQIVYRQKEITFVSGILFLFGFYYILAGVNYFSKVKRLYEQLDVMLVKRNERLEGTNIRMEFNDDGFGHTEKGYSFFLSWEMVKDYKVIGETILLTAPENGIQGYLIDSKELTDEENGFLLQLLANKIQNKPDEQKNSAQGTQDLLDN